ncbi:MAG: deoxyribodipyrimidine photo-lyase [Bacteriovoracaceae bacterium]|nr:deoxyribodipyrimidine photo-lyase [Bacteriovoracaceae bacterium]
MTKAHKTLALVWIRRDLRAYDHHALSQATQNHTQVQIIFNFDSHILNHLSDKYDRRVTFILESLRDLEIKIKEKNPLASLIVCYGDPVIEIPKLAKQLGATHVYANRDYEPYAKLRDEKVKAALQTEGLNFLIFKDQIIFESPEILSKQGLPFKVFTPYKNQWIQRLLLSQDEALSNFSIDFKVLQGNQSEWPNISDDRWWDIIGFHQTKSLLGAGTTGATELWKTFSKKILSYKVARDFPSLEGTSHLSVHLRHGTVSIRHLVRKLLEDESFKNENIQTWLSELIWREFYQGILDQNPHVVGGSYKVEYDQIVWPGSTEHFHAWCEGKTGYPIVDCAMRDLNQNGMMPNRLRMITAVFLVKTLLVDWRLGEKYFAKKLLDFDLAANNGGWQWCASTGTDAQPYFRIFNPYTQSEKFDPDALYIKKFCPELKDTALKNIHSATDLPRSYPNKIVEYETQRTRALSLYSSLKNGS